jgi:hypothetical protein
MSATLLQSLDFEGKLVGPAPDVPPDDLRALFRQLLMMRVLDQRMLSLQRRDASASTAPPPVRRPRSSVPRTHSGRPIGCSRP